MIGIIIELAILIVVGAIVFTAIDPDIPSMDFLSYFEFAPTSDLFWIMVIIGLVLLARAVPAKVKGVFYGLAVLVGMGWVYINFSPGIDSGFGWIKRCVNAECSAEATDYPRYNGGVLRLDSGEQETVRLTGKEVRVPNLTCHQPVIDPVPDVRWDAGYENFFIKPLPGLLEQVVTVSIVPSAESYACKQFWRGRPLHS